MRHLLHIIIYRPQWIVTVAVLLGDWLCCSAGTGLAREYMRTSQVTMYDNYFNSCRAALVVGVDSVDAPTMLLALTLEEGNVMMNAGDEVKLALRGGTSVTLQCVDDVRRGDIHLRRFKDNDIRTITIYLSIKPRQLTALVEADCRSITFMTSRGELRRTVKGTKARFNSLLKQLTDNGVKF